MPAAGADPDGGRIYSQEDEERENEKKTAYHTNGDTVNV